MTGVDFRPHIAVLFGDPNITDAVTYTPLLDVPKSVRGLKRTMDEVRSWFEAAVGAPGFVFEVQRTDVPQPGVGDEVVLGATTYSVRRWQLGKERCTWALDLVVVQ